MSDPTPPGEPEPGSTPPPPPPGWGAPAPQQPYGPTEPLAPGAPQHGQYGHQYGQEPQVSYPQGAYGSGFPGGPVTNQKSQWAMAVGLLAVPLGCCSGLLGLVGVVAIVLGVQARREIAASHGQQTGEGLAMTGIVSGAIAALIGILLSLLLAMLLIGGEILVTSS